jgi:hypothetical protein
MALAFLIEGIARLPPQSLVDARIDAKLLDDIEEEINRQLLVGTDGSDSIRHQNRLAQTMIARTTLTKDQLCEQNKSRLRTLVERKAFTR